MQQALGNHGQHGRALGGAVQQIVQAEVAEGGVAGGLSAMAAARLKGDRKSECSLRRNWEQRLRKPPGA